MASPKRVALLVGCNYAGKGCELHGCINDVRSVKEVLKNPRFGFKETNIVLLTDDKNAETEQPTGKNIKDKLQEMAKKSGPGDLLLFYFSGHGMRGNFTGNSPNEDEEAIVPSDFNVITKFDFRHVVDKVHGEATFVLISDSCHSGGLIDKEEEQVREAEWETIPVTESEQVKAKQIEYVEFIHIIGCGIELCLSDYMHTTFQMDASLCFHETKDYVPVIKKDKGILISGCRSEEYSFDLKAGLGKNPEPHGAFTAALLSVLQKDGNILSNLDVVIKVRKVLLVDNGFTQHSCLFSDKTNVNSTFLLQQSNVASRGIDGSNSTSSTVLQSANIGAKGGNLSSDILVEVTDIAVAYFRKCSKETREKMDVLIGKLDRENEGRVNVSDVYRVLVNKEGCNVEILSKFVSIIGWEVEVDRDQVLALYYASKSLIKFCGGCGKYLPTLYFSCLACFSTRDLEFDICASCLKRGMTCHQPDHEDFLDSHALLRCYHLAELKRSKGDSKGDVGEEHSTKEINKHLDNVETLFWKDVGLNEAFNKMPSAKQFDMGLCISTDICTIM